MVTAWLSTTIRSHRQRRVLRRAAAVALALIGLAPLVAEVVLAFAAPDASSGAQIAITILWTMGWLLLAAAVAEG